MKKGEYRKEGTAADKTKGGGKTGIGNEQVSLGGIKRKNKGQDQGD